MQAWDIVYGKRRAYMMGGPSCAEGIQISPRGSAKVRGAEVETQQAGFYRTDLVDCNAAEAPVEAARLGEVITARVGGEEITGRFDRIDDSGHLQLQTPSGARSIAAAEIYFRGT